MTFNESINSKQKIYVAKVLLKLSAFSRVGYLVYDRNAINDRFRLFCDYSILENNVNVFFVICEFLMSNISKTKGFELNSKLEENANYMRLIPTFLVQLMIDFFPLKFLTHFFHGLIYFFCK